MNTLVGNYEPAWLDFEPVEERDPAEIQGLIDGIFTDRQIRENFGAYVIHDTTPEFAKEAVLHYRSQMRTGRLLGPRQNEFSGFGGKLHRDIIEPGFTVNRVRSGKVSAVILFGENERQIVRHFRDDTTAERTQALVNAGFYAGPPISRALRVDLEERDALCFNSRRPHGFAGSLGRRSDVTYLSIRLGTKAA